MQRGKLAKWPGATGMVCFFVDESIGTERSNAAGYLVENCLGERVREIAKVTRRSHHLCHSSCTKLAEGGVPERTLLDIMGHVSAAMLRRHSHIRAKARREAIDALESRQISEVAAKVSAKVDASERREKPVTN